ncbi:O-Antigen ligase [Anaerocolumna jejuensis DSM 15929]|uniref:O-Antigen ligase n=1 Tax=Anaerocolumna jejuensis DSM 15929 TaxID=1121322 RepID=A0A1M6UGQ0_9FIRM|nr:O-antigen ligase family protein [Anaerocolumna jejuensis]SHK68323.1 O-Antigen ligase [Anaerocolumna jejuensis DSM 15929]
MKSNLSNKGNNKHYKNAGTSNTAIQLFPIIFIIAILPLIIRSYEYNPKLNQYPWFSDITEYMDTFLYYKQIFFIITCTIMLLAIIYKFFTNNRKLQFSAILYPMFIYGLLAFLSTLFSKHPSYGFSGSFEQFESVFVLLGYVIVLAYTFLYIKTENDLKKINHYFLIGIIVLGILGLFQAFGHDLIRTNFMKKLYIPSSDWGNLDSITFNFPLKTAFLTLYNPNYVGVYTSFVIPILISLLITEKNIKYRITYVFALLCMIISLISSGSAAGLLSSIITVFATIIIFRKKLFKHKKIAIGITLILSTAVLCLFFLKFDTITSAVNSKFSLVKSTYNISDIKTDKDLELTYKGNKLLLNYTFDNSQIDLTLKDSNNNTLPYHTESISYQMQIDDERYKNITITPVMYNNVLCMNLIIEGKDWVFTNQTGDGTFYYLNTKGKFDKMVTADSAIFTGYEKLISGRGYIWSRSIPLLKNNIILGGGADSFVFEFPQNDYLNYYNSGFEGQTLTKPHSLYLQVGIQTGLLSLIAMLVFYIMYFISSIRLYLKCNFDSYWEKTGAAYFLGSISYMIVCISNDSTVTVAPVFWTIIGIGVAINYKLSKGSV